MASIERFSGQHMRADHRGEYVAIEDYRRIEQQLREAQDSVKQQAQTLSLYKAKAAPTSPHTLIEVGGVYVHTEREVRVTFKRELTQAEIAAFINYIGNFEGAKP